MLCPRFAAVLLLVAVCLVPGCGDDVPAAALEDGCQPLLDGQHCLLPYPSDYFLVPDDSTPSGMRVEMSPAAAVTTDDGLDADPTHWRPMDGFSTSPLIVAMLPSAVSGEGLVDALGPYESSARSDSRTLVIDADTGQLIPHFVDIDPRAFDPLRRAIAIHPLTPLAPRTRYIVALRGVLTESGEVAESTQVFRLIRDGVASGGELAQLATRYETQIFPVLEDLGVMRSDLQLAWDFTTGSAEDAVGDMLAIRELTREWLASHDVEVEITAVEEDPAEGVWRRISGTMTGPLFMTTAEPGAAIYRDQNGDIAQNGTASFDFLISVPTSVRDQFGPARVLAFGHGFFGSRLELDGDRTRIISDELAVITMAIDWWGMSKKDMPEVVHDLADQPHATLRFTDRVHQAMANWMVATSALDGALPGADGLTRPPSGPGVSIGDGEASNAGQSLIDDGHGIYFLGISQGHILGGVLSAIHPQIERSILNVGGAGLSHVMFRARPFESFMLFIGRHFMDELDQYAWVAATQRQLDRIDPASYADYVLRSPLEGAVERQVLMQVALGDASLPNYASYYHARALGVSQLMPSGAEVYGLDKAEDRFSGSAVASYDFGIDTDFYRDAVFAENDNEVHELLRVNPAALEQMNLFLQPAGLIVNTCEGSCDPD